MTMQEGREVSGTLKIANAAKEDWRFRVEARFFNGTLGYDNGNDQDDSFVGQDVTIKYNQDNAPFSIIVPSSAGIFALCSNAQENAPFFRYRYYTNDTTVDPDMYVARQFDAGNASDGMNGLVLQAIEGKRLFGTLHRAAMTPLPAGGLNVCVKAYNDAFYTDQWLKLEGDYVDYMFVVPDGSFRYEYEIARNPDGSTPEGYTRRGYWTGFDRMTSADEQKRAMLNVNGDIDANLKLQTGYTLSGSIGLGNGETAVGKDIKVRVSLLREDGSFVDETNAIVKVNESTAGYAFTVPKDAPDAKYQIQFRCEDEAFITTAGYDETADKQGYVVVNGSQGTLLEPLQSTMLKPALLQRGNRIDGVFEVPAPVSKDTNITLHFSREDGSWQDTWLTLPKAATSAAWSVTVPAGSAGNPLMYWLNARFDESPAASWLQEMKFDWNGTAQSSVTTAYNQEETPIPVFNTNITGIKLAAIEGVRISGTIHAIGNENENGMKIGVGAFPAKQDGSSELNCYWGKEIYLEHGVTSGAYVMILPSDLGTRYPGYKYRMEYNMEAGRGHAMHGYYQEPADLNAGKGTAVPAYQNSSILDLTQGSLDRFDMNLIKGVDVTGRLSLPGDLKAPMGGLKVSMNMRTPDGIDQGCELEIKEGDSGADYIMTVPMSGNYEMSYHVQDTKGLAIRQWGTRKSDGSSASDPAKANSLNVTANLNADLQILGATLVSGTVSLPSEVHPATDVAIHVVLNSDNNTQDDTDDLYFGYDLTLGSGVTSAGFVIPVPADVSGNGFRLCAEVDPIHSNGLAMRTRYIDGASLATDRQDSKNLQDLAKAPNDLILEPGRTVSGVITLAQPITTAGGVVVFSDDESGFGGSWWFPVEAQDLPLSTLPYTLSLPYVKRPGGPAYTDHYRIGCNVYAEGMDVPTTYYRADGGTANFRFANAVSIASGAQTGINFTTRVMTSISGTVTLPTPVPDGMRISIQATHEDTGFRRPDLNYKDVPDGATTVPYTLFVPQDDTSFDYSVVVQVSKGPGVAQYAWYSDTGIAADNPVSASAISVPVGGRTGINLTLKAGKTVSGKLILPEPADKDMKFVVLAFRADRTVYADQELTIAAGQSEIGYSLSVVPGVYGIQYQTMSETPYTYSGNYKTAGTALKIADATMLDLTAGNLTGVNVHPIKTELSMPFTAPKFGREVRVPILVKNGQNVAGADISLHYDPAVAELVDVVSSAGFMTTLGKPEPGKARIAMARAEGMFGDFTLCTLVFRVQGNIGTQTDLGLNGTMLQNTGANGLPFTWHAGRIKVAAVTYGNASGDAAETVDAGDASLVLQHVASLMTLTGDRLLAADVNGDGQVNVGDAILILQKAVGLIDFLPIESK